MFVITLARKKDYAVRCDRWRRTNISHNLRYGKIQNNGTDVFCTVVSFGFPKNLPDYRITMIEIGRASCRERV